MKKIILYFFCVIIALVLYVVIFDNIYIEKTYIDANSGDIRKVEYVISIRIRDQVEKTVFSKLTSKLGTNYKGPVWKLDNVKYFSLLRRTFDFPEYHGSINACETFVKVLKSSYLSNEDKDELVRECLLYLQKGEIAKIGSLSAELISKNN